MPKVTIEDILNEADEQFTFGWDEPKRVTARYLTPLDKDQEKALRGAIDDAFDDLDPEEDIIDQLVMQYRALDDPSVSYADFASAAYDSRIEYLDAIVEKIDDAGKFYEDYAQMDEYGSEYAYLIKEGDFRDAQVDSSIMRAIKDSEELGYVGYKEKEIAEILWDRVDGSYEMLCSGRHYPDYGVLFGAFEVGELEDQLPEEITDELEALSKGEMKYIENNIEYYLKGDYLYINTDFVWYYYLTEDQAMDEINRWAEEEREANATDEEEV